MLYNLYHSDSDWLGIEICPIKKKSQFGSHLVIHAPDDMLSTEDSTFREVNNKLTGWAFAHLVNYFANPVN